MHWLKMLGLRLSTHPLMSVSLQYEEDGVMQDETSFDHGTVLSLSWKSRSARLRNGRYQSYQCEGFRRHIPTKNIQTSVHS